MQDADMSATLRFRGWGENGVGSVQRVMDEHQHRAQLSTATRRRRLQEPEYDYNILFPRSHPSLCVRRGVNRSGTAVMQTTYASLEHYATKIHLPPANPRE